jgi:hypothetical protein
MRGLPNLRSHGQLGLRIANHRHMRLPIFGVTRCLDTHHVILRNGHNEGTPILSLADRSGEAWIYLSDIHFVANELSAAFARR